MGTKLTFSALGRAKVCAWPYREDSKYPEKPEWLERQDASEGQDVHTMTEHWLAGEPVPLMGPRAAIIFERVKEALSQDQQGRRPEPSYAIDVQTGEARYLGNRLKRQYPPLGPNEICGTADWDATYDAEVGVSGAVEVGDLKTGFAGHVPHPRENLQQLAVAYAAAKVAGVKVAVVRTLIAREDETVPMFARLDGDWMERVLEELRIIHFGTLLPSPAVAGEHCQFCPAMGACPKTSHLGALVPGDGQVPVRWGTEYISAENDQQMVLHLPMLKAAVKAVESALKSRGPIELPNGKVWRETTKKITVVDQGRVEQLLGDRYASCLTEKEVSNGFRQVKP